jgi:glycine cleavage system H protein
MNIPQDLNYTATHEWVRQEADGSLTVGITDAAQDMLGDLVFVGDVKVGETLAAGETAGVVESVKAASDIYAPVAGEITAFNKALESAPEQLNADPYGAWIFKITPSAGAAPAGLLDAAAYQAALAAEK